MAVAQREELKRLLANLTFREQLSLLMAHGVPAVDIMGINDCTLHAGWHPLHPLASLAFDGTVLWCTKCWKWVQK